MVGDMMGADMKEGVKEVTVVKEVMACDVSWRLATGDGLIKTAQKRSYWSLWSHKFSR